MNREKDLVLKRLVAERSSPMVDCASELTSRPHGSLGEAITSRNYKYLVPQAINIGMRIVRVGVFA